MAMDMANMAIRAKRTQVRIGFVMAHSCNRLLAAKMSEQELKAIDAEVREIVNAAADFAQHDPEPDASELYTDIYR